MNNDSLISVIVPVYNVEMFVDQCIDSIVKQTYTNLEILLIDDGSLDESGNVSASTSDEYTEPIDMPSGKTLFSVILVTFFLSKPISAYQLGETYAKNLGVNVQLLRVLLILLSSILSASVTAFAGPISFVGIAVPHLTKSLLKTAKPILVIPACFLGGAVFCLFCDLIARTAFAPTELSISSVTAVFGAPVVIYVMIHKQKRG